MFRYIVFIALLWSAPLLSFAQEENKTEAVDAVSAIESTLYSKTVKLNSIVLVGVVNTAVEFRLSRTFALQTELLLSPYFNNCLGTGKPFACVLGYVEGRYYVRRAMSGFFFGPVAGGGAYKMNKGIYPLYREQYKDDSYQQGWNYMLGLSVGYQFELSSRWSLEINWGGGYQHSWYRGYRRDTKDEPYYEYVGWNMDAEFLPFFKGGVLVGYRF